MPKKLTATELKKKLAGLSQGDLIALICRVYKDSPEAKNIVNIVLGDSEYESQLLDEKKKELFGLFFPVKGYPKESPAVTKKMLSDFRKLGLAQEHTIEFQVYFLECCTVYTATYGDMSEAFWNGVEREFATAVEILNQTSDKKLLAVYYPRLLKVVEGMRDVGFGVYENLSKILYESLISSQKSE